MEAKRHIHERHGLEDEIQEGRDARDRAVAADERVGLDSPDEHVGEDADEEEEHEQEHVVQEGPAQRAQEHEQEGEGHRIRDSVHDLDAVTSEDLVQVRVDDLRLTQQQCAIQTRQRGGIRSPPQ